MTAGGIATPVSPAMANIRERAVREAAGRR
jgi:hypothetical protein